MKKYCDCCGIEDGAPVSVVGYASQVGWTTVRDLDFCGLCINKLNNQAIDRLSDKSFKEIVDNIKEDAEKNGILSKIFVSTVS